MRLNEIAHASPTNVHPLLNDSQRRIAALEYRSLMYGKALADTIAKFNILAPADSSIRLAAIVNPSSVTYLSIPTFDRFKSAPFELRRLVGSWAILNSNPDYTTAIQAFNNYRRKFIITRIQLSKAFYKLHRTTGRIKKAASMGKTITPRRYTESEDHSVAKAQALANIRRKILAQEAYAKHKRLVVDGIISRLKTMNDLTKILPGPSWTTEDFTTIPGFTFHDPFYLPFRIPHTPDNLKLAYRLGDLHADLANRANILARYRKTLRLMLGRR